MRKILKNISMYGFKKLHILLLTVLVMSCVGVVGVMMMNGVIGYDAAANVVTFSRMGVFCLIYSIVTWYILRREVICPYIIYMVCCYIFMFGQCLFWAFGIIPEHKSLYIRYTDEIMLPAMVYNVLCFLAIQIGAVLSAKDLSKNRFESSLIERKKKTEESMQAIKISAWLLFVVSALPYYYELLQNLNIVMQNNYKQIYLQAGGSRFDEILEVLRSFYLPSLLMLIVAYPKSRSIFLICLGLMGVEIVSCAMIGGRANAFLVMFGVICVWHYVKKPLDFFKILIIALIAYIMLMAGTVIGYVRNSTDRTMDTYIEAFETASEEENPFVSAFGEMGWTMSNTVEVMNRVPYEEDFRYGSSYFYSLTTIIPNLGFWEKHPASVHANLASWLQKAMNLWYGPGFSPAAESYINFGWFGIFFMILEGFILGKMLTMADRYSLKYNPEAFSVSIVFLLVATKNATRASTIALVRSILYNVLPVFVLIQIVKYTMRRVNKKVSTKNKEENDASDEQNIPIGREMYE